MRILIQRVLSGSVRTVEKTETIQRGLVILAGVGPNDTEQDADFLAAKTAGLRIFSNESGKFDYSISDVGGEALVVSQFTLYADTSKGRRPDFTGAARPETAERLYLRFAEALRKIGINVKTGTFGSHMEVNILNDGPVTIFIDSEKKQEKI